MELIPLLSTIIFIITVITFIVAVASYIVFRMKEKRKQPSAPPMATIPSADGSVAPVAPAPIAQRPAAFSTPEFASPEPTTTWPAPDPSRLSNAQSTFMKAFGGNKSTSQEEYEHSLPQEERGPTPRLYTVPGKTRPESDQGGSAAWK